jgi:hypothetical protein
MIRKVYISRCGFTILELVIASVAAIIVLSAVSVLISDGQRGWNTMYNNLNSPIVTDAYIAKKRFDSVVRKAARDNFLIDNEGQWLEVYYYESESVLSPDSYARFFVDSNDLNIEYGRLNPRETISVHTVCSNVSSCLFKQIGKSAQMLLSLNNGNQTVHTVSSAVLHN